jgi:hypothetical protein
MPQAGRVAFGKMEAVTFANGGVGLFARVPPQTPRRARRMMRLRCWSTGENSPECSAQSETRPADRSVAL